MSEPAPQEDQEKQKRKRRVRGPDGELWDAEELKAHEAKQAQASNGGSEAQAQAPAPTASPVASTGEVLERPRFSPQVVSLHSNAVRKISVGPYESMEFMSHAEFTPDPNYTVNENATLMTKLMGHVVDTLAEETRRQIQLRS